MSSSVIQDDKLRMNLETVENHLDIFLKNFRDTIERFKNEMVFLKFKYFNYVFINIQLSRLEITSTVREPSYTAIMDGLANAIDDSLSINKSCLFYYDGSDYIQYMDFYKYVLQGLSSSAISLVKTPNNPNSSFTMPQKLLDFQKCFIELRNLFSHAWNGKIPHFSSSSMCPRIEIARGRPILNIFKKYFIKILLENPLFNKYFKIFLEKNKINYQETIQYLENIWNQETKLINPKIIINGFINKTLNKSNQAKVCKHCWQLFLNENDCKSDYLSHPCHLPVENRSNNDDSPLLNLYDPIFEKYLEDVAKTFSPSQNKAAMLSLDGSSNVWIYGVAGFGKSYVTDWIIKCLMLKYNPDKVLVCAMTKVSAKILDGKTMHSVFKLGTLNVDIYQYIHQKGDKLKDTVNKFITIYYNTREKVEEMLKKEVLVVDECVQWSKELHDFLNELMKQLRCRENKYFGGMQVIIAGDPLQKKGGFLDRNMRASLESLNIQVHDDLADDFFFLSEEFLSNGNFEIIVLQKHENFRYTINEWFEFCSRCRTGELTKKDFDYINDKSKIGYGISDTDQEILRSYALNVNKQIILQPKEHVEEQEFINNQYSKTMTHRINKNYVSKKRLEKARNRIDFKINDILQHETLFNETIFICTENIQVAKYSEIQDIITTNESIHSSNIFTSSAIDELWAIDPSKNNSEILIPNFFDDGKNKNVLDYVNKQAKSIAEKKVVFKVGQAGNITSNACGKYLATSQRFTIKSVNELNKIVNSITIQPHETNSKYSPTVEIKKEITEYPIIITNIPYNIRKKYNNFFVRRKQFPISMTNSKTVQYVMGLTIPDGILCLDNTRGTNYTEGFTGISRKPDPKYLMFVHDFESYEEMLLYFKPHPIALKLDQYINNECKRLESCIVKVNFIYDREKEEFKNNNATIKKLNAESLKLFNKYIK